MSEQQVRVRIAPSPTGPCHLGTARTALFNYLFAKHHDGAFIFRLEDTDRERSTPEFEQELYDSLHWLGLDWDEGPDVGGDYGPYRQSERTAAHRAAIEQLIETEHAYRCFCTPEALEAERKRRQQHKLPQIYPGTCRDLTPDQVQANLDARKPFTVRFNMPDETYTFTDLIRGEVTVEGIEISDFVIARVDGSPVFHLTNVVDDAQMAITHIMRGEDHLSNVPKHIALFRALGHEPPAYAHFPLIMNPDGSKMSKRKQIEGLEPYVNVFRQHGYLPEAMLNYLALLGWSSGTDEEFFTLDGLIERFTLDAVAKSSARFDMKKLDDINGHYIRAMSPEALISELKARLPEADDAYLQRIAPLVKERLGRFDEAPEYMRFFFNDVDYPTELLKVKGHTLKGAATMIWEVLQWLLPLPEREFSARLLDENIRATAEKAPYKWKARKLFMVMRIAVTGKTATPPLFETMEVLGKEVCVHRLQSALVKLASIDVHPNPQAGEATDVN